MQVTDCVTRPLMSVPKICESGYGVWFGPAPNYESYIVYDPSCVAIAPCKRTPVNLRNGVYEIKLGELRRVGGGVHGNEKEPDAEIDIPPHAVVHDDTCSNLFEETPENPNAARYIKNPLQPSC